MANGGWYGTAEEWAEAERPLQALDAMLEQFSTTHKLRLSKNHKNWPERSLRGDLPLASLIQVFRVDLDRDAWNVWVVCSEDRGAERYWKEQTIADAIPGEELKARLPLLLEYGLERLLAWNAKPEELEAATTIRK